MGIVNRVSQAYHSTSNTILLSWAAGVYTPGGGSSNPFDLTSNNPNTNGPGGGPYPITYATCRAGVDGNCTISLTAGFTAPVSLVIWEYNRNAGLAGGWFRLGANSSIYELAFDATYTQSTFKASEGSIILVQSTSAITQVAYTDGTIDRPKIAQQLEGFG